MDSSQKMVVGIVAVIAVLLIVNIFLLWGLQKTAPADAPGSPNDPETSKTGLIAIVSDNCSNCIALTGLIDQLKQLDLNFSERQLVFETDSEAKQLVQQYKIESLPSVVIKTTPADFAALSERWQSLGTAEDNNVLVLRKVPPPYYDIASQSVRGLVEFWSISKKDCLDCTSAPTTAALEQFGISFSQVHELDAADSAAQALISQYSIARLPTIVLSKEISQYSALSPMLESAGDFSSDGSWVLRYPIPYYWDLQRGKKMGAVSLTRITFSDCNGCFALNQLEDFLVQNFSLRIASDQNLDWSTPEGKKFVSDYNISRIPTLVLSGEIPAYAGLAESWPSFGFVTSDRQLVFAQHPQLGPEFKYFDIDKNQLAAPPAPNPSGG